MCTRFLIFALLGLLFSCSDPQKKPQITYDDYIGYYKVGNPYQINNQWSFPEINPTFEEIGEASWYGDKFNGRQTANGDIFDKQALTAAHRTLPMPSMVRVTNKSNNKTIILMVNDRGPFAKDRVIDLSERAATILGYKDKGITDVKVEFLPGHTQKLWADYKIDAQLADIMPKVPTYAPSNEFAENINIEEKTFANTPPDRPVTPNIKPIKPQDYASEGEDNDIQTHDLANLEATLCLKGDEKDEKADKNNDQNFSPMPNEFTQIDSNNTESDQNQYRQIVNVDIADVKYPAVLISKSKASNDDSAVIDEVNKADLSENESQVESDNSANAKYIQIGSYGQSENANSIKNSLSQLGNIDIYPINMYKKILYRVRLGPLFGNQVTSTALSNVQGLGYKDAIIVAEN